MKGVFIRGTTGNILSKTHVISATHPQQEKKLGSGKPMASTGTVAGCLPEKRILERSRQ